MDLYMEQDMDTEYFNTYNQFKHELQIIVQRGYLLLTFVIDIFETFIHQIMFDHEKLEIINFSIKNLNLLAFQSGNNILVDLLLGLFYVNLQNQTHNITALKHLVPKFLWEWIYKKLGGI